jgi:sulfide:quinone oxidoreductase
LGDEANVAKASVVVVGGGVAGLETAFSLRRRLGERVSLTLVSDRDQFLFKPDTVYVPFGLDPDRLIIPLERPTRRRGIRFVHAGARAVDPAARLVHLDGRSLPYDYLVVAAGARGRPAEIPGLAEYAEMIATPEGMLKLRARFARLLADAGGGKRRRVLFLVPPHDSCVEPLYELVLMLDTWLQKHGARGVVDLAWSTHEESFVQAFGPRLHGVVMREFARRGINGFREHVVDRVEPHEVLYRNGRSLEYDLLVSFPPYVGAAGFAGLPQDERGFLRTNPLTRQVLDNPNIYAVGDAGDFPLKQATLAVLQADAAAEHLSAELLGTLPTRRFDPVGVCLLDELDTATFAQVPLRVTGLPERPVEVRPDADGRYRVGSSPLWRVGKKLLSLYVPWRFGGGSPFRAGLPWKGMELGLRLMMGALAK